AWIYLFDGPRMIQDSFEKADGNPFEINAPDNRYIFVSSPKHIKELDSAPDTVLSLQAASKQMLQPMYTMHGFNWFDRRGTEGVGFIRALRTLLTNNLPEILPDLSIIMRARFNESHATHRVEKGRRYSPVYPMIVNLVVLCNAVSFFGKDLAKNEQFMKSALCYVEETLICAEIVKLLPPSLAQLMGGIMGRRLKSQKIIFDALLPIAEDRCRERDLKAGGQAVPHHADCIQWIMETSPRSRPWTPKRIVHELMAIWFGSVHALSTTITFGIHDLCLHPEYVKPLRQELHAEYAEFERTAKGLPLLDSFIKESARLTPVESMSTRRSALKPFTLSDGTTVHPGEWACTPVQSIMQSSQYFPAPLEFRGFRFAESRETKTMSPEGLEFRQPSPSKLTDTEHPWHVWGTGRMACPGRFYAVAVMKVVLGQVILNYNCELAEPESPRWLIWRSTMLPKASTAVVFTPL
ncbi:cytochrome P450, partial [Diaporthe sp. PMI_573]